MTPLAQAAIAYAQRGIAVFPLMPRFKKPYGRTQGFKAALADPAAAADWWAGQRPIPLKPDAELPLRDGAPDTRPVFASGAANVGVATGEVSGFWVLDLDGDEAEAWLDAVVAVHGPLPETVEQVTAGGRHICFKWDARHPLRNSAGKVGPHVDVRGNGGYIVAPPSVHPGDEKRGIPPGRLYAWTPGRSPEDVDFAYAPDWLLQLVLPKEEPRQTAPTRERVAQEGRASRFGEACLATACRNVQHAPNGQRQSALWGYSCFIGGLVAGGEIERAYARDELVAAALNMTNGLCDTPSAIEKHVERGLDKGELHPRKAPELEGRQRGTPRQSAASPSPSQVAGSIRDARGLWASARSADCGAFRTWLKVRSLDAHALPVALQRLRAHQSAPIGPRGREMDKFGPALLVPLMREPEALEWSAPVDALGILPLFDSAEAIRGFVGDRTGGVAMLTPRPASGAVLVALDLQDAWALGANAAENGHDVGLVLAPTLRAFAGGFMGDRYGRVDPRTPDSDPEDPPFTLEGAAEVFLAVRGDLTTPQLRTRKTWGGTDRVTLEGDAAARFYAGLAEQAWRRAGANAVRTLRASGGAGFNSGRRGGGR